MLVEETPGGSVGECPSSLPVEVCRDIAGAAPPVGFIDDVDDVAKGVAPDASYLAEAWIPFPACPVGTLSLTERDGTLSPTDPAGILFPADLAEPVTVGVVGLANAGILKKIILAQKLYGNTYHTTLVPRTPALRLVKTIHDYDFDALADISDGDSSRQ